MTLEAARTLLSSPTESTVDSFLDGEAVVWIDWRHEDDGVVTDIEDVLATGVLSAEWVDADNALGADLQITYGDKTCIPQLEGGSQDRHLTLVALNQLFQADYEARLCLDFEGGDSIPVLPMSVADWQALEAEFGDSVANHFYKITPYPNLFTDPVPFWQ